MTSSYEIRPRVDADDPSIARVNHDNVPEVGPLDDERFALFRSEATRFDVVTVDGAVEGIFVGLTNGLDYQSPNYQWFAERYETFAYIDRIALQPAARGIGAAAEIYRSFEAEARAAGHRFLCAEVNVVPPNPRSLAFHRRHGFDTVAEQAPYGSDERVAMVVKDLS